ncbi:MAG: carbohydrate ABC transporter permease [Anaerolineae bacterium]
MDHNWNPIRILAGLFLGIMGLLYIFPIFWMATTSLKSTGELYGYPPTLVPLRPTFQAYTSLLFEKGYGHLIRNSLIINLLTIALTLALALLINYPLARLRVSTRAGRAILNGILAIRFIPGIIMIIPFYAIILTVGLYDTIWSLVLIYTVFNLPLAVYMLNGFLQEIPIELEEAALVDGATRRYAFLAITLPQLSPAILAIAVITFALSWNDFLFALILTATPAAQTFSIGVWRLVSQFQILWNEMAAAAVIAMTIPILLLVFVRRYLLAALTFGIVREKA